MCKTINTLYNTEQYFVQMLNNTVNNTLCNKVQNCNVEQYSDLNKTFVQSFLQILLCNTGAIFVKISAILAIYAIQMRLQLV